MVKPILIRGHYARLRELEHHLQPSLFRRFAEERLPCYVPWREKQRATYEIVTVVLQCSRGIHYPELLREANRGLRTKDL